jgi:hypothetical protein
MENFHHKGHDEHDCNPENVFMLILTEKNIVD